MLPPMTSRPSRRAAVEAPSGRQTTSRGPIRNASRTRYLHPDGCRGIVEYEGTPGPRGCGRITSALALQPRHHSRAECAREHHGAAGSARPARWQTTAAGPWS
jgi:hypothetical protein